MLNFQDLSRFSVPRGFRGKSSLYVQLWWSINTLFLKTSPQFAYGWRRFLLRAFGAKIGRNVIIRPSVNVTYPWFLSIEDNAWIGDDVHIYNLAEIFIGKNSVVSQKCYLCTGSHDMNSQSFDITAKPIHIGEQVWLATDVFVSQGVTIGDGTVVGSRSSVFKSLEGSNVYFGTPVRFVRKR